MYDTLSRSLLYYIHNYTCTLDFTVAGLYMYVRYSITPPYYIILLVKLIVQFTMYLPEAEKTRA